MTWEDFKKFVTGIEQFRSYTEANALMERLESEPHARLRYFCSPQHTDSALYPIIGQMERTAGFAHGDGAQMKLEARPMDCCADAVQLIDPSRYRHASKEFRGRQFDPTSFFSISGQEFRPFSRCKR